MAWTKTGTLVAPTATRATATATTSSLGAGVSTTATTITLSKGYTLLSIATSKPARVQLYATAAAMTADAGRAVGTDPTVLGVALDYVTTGTSANLLSPPVTGFNEESSPSATISMRVTNNDSTSGAITVTLVWLKVE
jgi:hypothetical protein